jgi:hypothetical protein
MPMTMRLGCGEMSARLVVESEEDGTLDSMGGIVC